MFWGAGLVGHWCATLVCVPMADAPQLKDLSCSLGVEKVQSSFWGLGVSRGVSAGGTMVFVGSDSSVHSCP